MTNVVAATLSEVGTADHRSVIAELVSGASVATWALGEPPPDDRLGHIALEVRIEGDTAVLNGVKRPVESAGDAGHLLVTGRTGPGLTQVLVAEGTPGLAVAPLESVDMTRRFSTVSFDDVRVPVTAVVGRVGEADEQVDRQLRWALAIGSAESVGAMQTAFDLTLEWAFDRYSFGRPLASYQELKHRFADMKTWLEAGHAISDAATVAVATGAPDADELLSAAAAFIGASAASCSRTACRSTVGSGSPSNTTSTSISAATRSTAPCTARRRSTASVSPPSSSARHAA